MPRCTAPDLHRGGGDDEIASHLVGDVGTVVRPHNVQAEVDARCAAGGREDVPLVHVQHLGVDGHRGEAAGHFLALHPVGGGATPVEQPGHGQDEGTGAQ